MMIFHEDLNIYAIVGALLLIGIVKKNAIMMIRFRSRGAAPGTQAACGRDLPGREPLPKTTARAC